MVEKMLLHLQEKKKKEKRDAYNPGHLQRERMEYVMFNIPESIGMHLRALKITP